MATQVKHDSSPQLLINPTTSVGAAPAPGERGTVSANSPPAEMPSFDLLSDTPLPEIPEEPLAGVGRTELPQFESLVATPPSQGEQPGGTERKGKFWFEGNALMCACPDCLAPMTIRLFLMVADCWRCGTSIELSEEEEREIQRLIDERDRRSRASRTAASPQANLKRATENKTPPTANGESKPERPKEDPKDYVVQSSLAPSKHAPTAKTPKSDPRPSAKTPAAPDPSSKAAPSKTKPAEPPPNQRQQAKRQTAADNRARRRIQSVTSATGVTATLHDLFRMTPAWLVSLVLHFMLLTLLAILMMPEEDEKGPEITLSVSPDNQVREGGDLQINKPIDDVKFDLPIPTNVDVENPEVKEAILQADQDAKELRLNPNATDPNLADLRLVKQKISSDPSPRRTFAARDPRVRVEMVKAEGGTTMTEAAVARALRFLSAHQHDDGSWGCNDFTRAGPCKSGAGSESSRTAGTALALLPFLGAGQTHLTGTYKNSVAKALRYLIKHQDDNGYLRGGRGASPSMYAHGQGAIVLCEAFAMEGDEEIRKAAQKAINFIVASQYNDGGWRYHPGPPAQRGDTSVVGWQVMALQSARAAGLEVPDTTWNRADQFLDSVQYRYRRGGTRGLRDPRLAAMYGYTGPQDAVSGNRINKHALSAEGLLCRMYLGWTIEEQDLVNGIDVLLEQCPPNRGPPNMYYWYYMTQVMHNYGGAKWDAWNEQMRDILVRSQETDGPAAGSWSTKLPIAPHGSFEWGRQGGRIYVTALATCTLEVYYRHLPIFKQIKLD